MNVLVIARVAHTINAAFCLSLGDESQPTWEEAPEWQQKSAVAGVEMHLANPEATPEQSHESWLAQKVADGWVYGEVKDADKKEHPCCRPYAELPPEQKSKDYLFRAVVHALKEIPDADKAVEAALASVPKAGAVQVVVGGASFFPAGHLAVEYIGRRETFTDHLYGSGLVFDKGQVRVLPVELARKFLRHADQFSESVAPAAEGQEPSQEQGNSVDDTADKLAAAQKLQDQQRDKENQLQDLKDQLNNMTKKSLSEYALTNYRQKLDQSKSVADLRQQVVGMLDQFGAV